MNPVRLCPYPGIFRISFCIVRPLLTLIMPNLTFTERQNFGPNQIESIDRQQNICKPKQRNCVLQTIENTVGRGENTGDLHFLLFPQCFQKASIAGSLQVWIPITQTDFGEIALMGFPCQKLITEE